MRRWTFFVVLLCALGVFQAWLVQRAHEEMARAIRALVPHGELRYARLWPLPWGELHVWGLRFQPEGLLRLNLQTPPGFALHAAHLRLHGFSRDADGGLTTLRARLRGLEFEPEPATPLRVDLRMSTRYEPGDRLAELSVEARDSRLGRLELRAQIEGRAQDFTRTQDQLRLRHADFALSDSALLGDEAWRAYFARLHAQARAQRWNAQTLVPLAALAKGQSDLSFTLNPPGEVHLRNLRLYAPRDWVPVLGLHFPRQDDQRS